MAETQPPKAGGDAGTLHQEIDKDSTYLEVSVTKEVTGEHVDDTAVDDTSNASAGHGKGAKPSKLILEKVSQSSGNTTNPNSQSAVGKAALYQRGEDLLKTGKTEEALECFLSSLKGLTESNTFQELPQCLHQISDMYFSKNEYEKAVYFIQAEKMYYETALLDILAFQQEVANKRKKKETEGELPSDSGSANDEHQAPARTENVISPEIIKANEFENLANLCLKEGSLQLAIDYCGKATKLFRETYGDEHPRTIKALELFTCIYADVGKQLYEDAMEMFEADNADNQSSPQVSYAEESSAGVRHRKKVTFSEDARLQESEPVVTQELEPTPLPEDQDDWMVTCLLMVIFFLATILVALIASYFYCRNDADTPFCAELRGDLTHWYITVRQLYLRYVKGEDV